MSKTWKNTNTPDPIEDIRQVVKRALANNISYRTIDKIVGEIVEEERRKAMTRDPSDITAESIAGKITTGRLTPSAIDIRMLMPIPMHPISDDTITRRKINWFRLLINYIKRVFTRKGRNSNEK